MLIEFRVKNFLSIQDEQVFSMVANADKAHLDTHTSMQLQDLRLLKSSAIYGANAAGKSSFIKAINTMQEIILKSAKQQRGEKIPIIPFLLASSIDKASAFEITFLIDNIRYQYGFSATQERILEEWLLVYAETNRAQKWFERIYDTKSEKYEWRFGTKFLGQKKLWQNSTRDNALFLSTAVQLNSTQLQLAFDWLAKKLKIGGVNSWSDGDNVTIDMYQSGKLKKIVEFFKIADLDINDIKIQEEEFNEKMLPDDMPKEFKEQAMRELQGKKLLDISLIHLNQQEEKIPINLENESDGTQKFFKLIGPWLDSLENGNIVIIDELHNHLHPLMTKFLIELFHNKDLNKSNAQLIFTTHETSVLNQDIFRRDQIWFCEKQDKATKLYPLSDFKPRKETNLEDSYLSGRFGALPYFQDISLAMGRENGE